MPTPDRQAEVQDLERRVLDRLQVVLAQDRARRAPATNGPPVLVGQACADQREDNTE